MSSSRRSSNLPVVSRSVEADRREDRRMKLPKLSFPESPTVSQSKSFWNSVLTATPVVLTVFATVLAGLSTSEMTLAQYHRSMAAQDQSKASDQWNLFQAKRIRGTEVERTIRLLQALS